MKISIAEPEYKLLSPKRLAGRHARMSLSDDRPHFEVLGDKFSRNSPGSEEEIWVPVILKV